MTCYLISTSLRIWTEFNLQYIYITKCMNHSAKTRNIRGGGGVMGVQSPLFLCFCCCSLACHIGRSCTRIPLPRVWENGYTPPPPPPAVSEFFTAGAASLPACNCKKKKKILRIIIYMYIRH